MQNQGKRFEQDIQASCPGSCWIYRLRDNASSFSGGDKTRFTSSNICDYILLDDNSKTLFLLELKSVQSTSIPFSLIRENQIKGLLEASKHQLVAGFLFNYRNENNDTFFMFADNFADMMKSIGKKSFNVKDCEKYGATRVGSTKKRTRYTYDIGSLVEEMHL
jgi:recombination protein U